MDDQLTDKMASAIYHLWEAFLIYKNEEPDTHTECVWGRILLWYYMGQRRDENVLDFIADFHYRYCKFGKWREVIEKLYRQMLIQKITLA